MRGHIRARRGPRGTSYQIVVYAGVDERGHRRHARETIDGSKRDAERRLSQLIAAVDTGQGGRVEPRAGQITSATGGTGSGRRSGSRTCASTTSVTFTGPSSSRPASP